MLLCEYLQSDCGMISLSRYFANSSRVRDFKTLIERAVQSILPHVEEIIIAAPKDFELEISALFSDNKKIKVIGYTVVGSYKGFDVISEI